MSARVATVSAETPSKDGVRAEQAWLHPAGTERFDASAALAYLRAAGVLAAVQAGAVEPGEPVDAVFLLDDDDRVIVVEDGTVTRGESISTFGPRMAAELGLGVETGEHQFTDPRQLAVVDADVTSDDEATHDEATDEEAGGCGDGCSCGSFDPTGLPGDVLVSHKVDSFLPVLAHHAEAGLEHAWVDGWNVVRFDRACVDLSDDAWLPHEVPAAVLITDGETRYVEVLTGWGVFPGEMLTRLLDLTPTFTTAEVDHRFVPGLANLHLLPDSDLRRVLNSPHFRDRDAGAVAEALQSAPDEFWSARVLTTLGLPVLAADVHEGRSDLPAARRVEARSGLRSLFDSVVGYHEAGEEEVARRTPFGKAYAWVQARPAVAGTLYATETATAAVLLARANRPGRSRWARTGVRTLAATLLLDAAMGVALRSRRRD
ncbi:MAG: hypothetical protein ACI379_16045 [Nocardioides sp.]|uniref:hypothetical protein n=1 Tax=Nocardioides sp. TaxID=35761 RepID=UPI003F0F02CC